MKKRIIVLAVAAASIILSQSSCQKEEDILSSSTSQLQAPDISEKGMNPDEAILSDEAARHNLISYLYTESNATSGNEVLSYKQHPNGSLTLESTTASGGTGVGIFNGLGLDSQGALALSRHSHLLFAVNAGSNSISSFVVHNDGSLTLANTVASGGVNPSSVCVNRNVLYVLNNTSSNINGYTFDATGMMTEIPGSNLPLSVTMADAAQIAFSPNGHYLYVTERATNTISSYEVDASGLAIVDQATPSTGNTPFGFEFGRDNYMVVSNANVVNMMPTPNASSCTSYGGSNQGNLNAQNGAVANNQTAACWVATTMYGRFAYNTNTGTDNISTWYISPWGNLYLIHASIPAGDAPKDICVVPNNYYVYALNTGTGSLNIGGFHRAFLGNLVSIGTTPGLPEFAAGLVAW